MMIKDADRLGTLRPPPASATNGKVSPPRGLVERKHRSRRTDLIPWGVAGLLIVAAAAATAIVMLAAPSKALVTPPPQSLTAHGVIQPVARANSATMTGGVIEDLPVAVGQIVEARQPLARVSLAGQTELLVAPWRGTVIGVSANLGDSVLPGALLVTIADLSRYQIESTDVDEYLIGHITTGQPVSMTVEALDQVRLEGIVRSVSLQQQSSSSGSNYPIVIDLASPNSNLRPGMTVRITFLGQLNVDG